LVANGDRVFSAGMFVRVRVPLGEPRKQLLITERAIGSDQGQKYVFVVVKNKEGKEVVEYRPIGVGPPQKGGLRVVFPLKLVRSKEGLRMARPEETTNTEDSISPTDRVIVDGIQRARPGLEVRVNEVKMPERLPLLETKGAAAKPAG
jgi:multidrug efflux pump subunit AcrA (membrane-fusion protein)